MDTELHFNKLDQMTELAEQIKLLGDRTRLIMLALLRDREWCVCDFVDLFHISQPGISQHMRKLKSHKIVKEERRGQWVYYSLNVADKPHIQAVLEHLPPTEEILRMLNKPEAGSCSTDTDRCC